jgi:hypothetical protein
MNYSEFARLLEGVGAKLNQSVNYPEDIDYWHLPNGKKWDIHYFLKGKYDFSVFETTHPTEYSYYHKQIQIPNQQAVDYLKSLKRGEPMSYSEFSKQYSEFVKLLKASGGILVEQIGKDHIHNIVYIWSLPEGRQWNIIINPDTFEKQAFTVYENQPKEISIEEAVTKLKTMKQSKIMKYDEFEKLLNASGWTLHLSKENHCVWVSPEKEEWSINVKDNEFSVYKFLFDRTVLSIPNQEAIDLLLKSSKKDKPMKYADFVKLLQQAHGRIINKVRTETLYLEHWNIFPESEFEKDWIIAKENMHILQGKKRENAAEKDSFMVYELVPGQVLALLPNQKLIPIEEAVNILKVFTNPKFGQKDKNLTVNEYFVIGFCGELDGEGKCTDKCSFSECKKDDWNEEHETVKCNLDWMERNGRPGKGCPRSTDSKRARINALKLQIELIEKE